VKDPDHHAARIGRFEVAAIRGAQAEIVQRGDALVDHPAATAWDLNYVAWHRIALGGDLGRALELARRAVDKAPREAEYLRTLATIEAELGDLDRAIHDSWKAMDLSGADEPTSYDWYTLGRIDEQLGLSADAFAAYKRVTRSKFDELLDVFELAQRRLAKIAAAP